IFFFYHACFRARVGSKTIRDGGAPMNRSHPGLGTRRAPPSDALGTALWLSANGLWPVPITPPDDGTSPNPGQAPIGRRWGVIKPSTRALFAIFKRHPRAGIGIVLGPASGVVDLEVDDPRAAGPLLNELFPRGLPPTMGWMSSRGEHRLFRWDERLGPSRSAVVHLAGGALELRLGSGGRQVAAVCPPPPPGGGGAPPAGWPSGGPPPPRRLSSRSSDDWPPPRPRGSPGGRRRPAAIATRSPGTTSRRSGARPL